MDARPSASPLELEKMPTGIPGLDHILRGGIVRGNSLLIEGSPGSGKSTLAVRIIYQGVVCYDEPGLIVTFEEFPRQVYQDALSYGLDLRALEQRRKLRIVWTSPARILEGFTGKSDLIDSIITDLGAKRLVIDSITHFKRVAESEVGLREVLSDILSNLKIRGVNAILIKELERKDDATIAFEEYLVDSSLRVHNTLATRGGPNTRFVEIRKTRGQEHISGLHPFELGERGFQIFPRWRPQDIEDFFSDLPSVDRTGRADSGIHGLDVMLAGGFRRGTFNMLSGQPGTGKTILAYHFINAGLRKGESCLVMNFGPEPQEIVRYASTLGLDWSDAWESGRLRTMSSSTVSLCVEQVLSDAMEQLHRLPAQRIVFDGIDDLRNGVPSADVLRDYLFLLAQILRAAGATSVFTSKYSVGSGSLHGMEEDFSYLANTVIQLSMAESDGEIRRFASVWKHGASDHAKELREFRIDSAGFHVEHKATGLSGILTGQTRGSMKQVGDQVLPALHEVVNRLASALADPTSLPAGVREHLAAARSNVGLLDVLLHEHFGATQFHKLVDELAEELGDHAVDELVGEALQRSRSRLSSETPQQPSSCDDPPRDPFA